MTTMCFRPPPLPPSRKTSGQNQVWSRFKVNNSSNSKSTEQQQQQHFLSSTYHSFYDPIEEDDFAIHGEQIELKRVGVEQKSKSNSSDQPLLLRANSFHRQLRQKRFLFRSQSDGNLNDSSKKNGVYGSMSIYKYIKVLNGSWKNLLNIGGMSRPPKPLATPKKVAPPAVPHEFRHSGSSFGSVGYSSSEETAFMAPPDSTTVTREDHSDYGSSGKSPGPVFPAPTFTFPGQSSAGGVLTHKAAVYYHNQLSLQEDQGIDMTQSPGRDSPGSSSGSAGSGSGSRHSTASLDSGRASYHPLSSSTAGRSTIGSSSSPRCSLSSCSIGSDQGRIERMIQQGLPDQEIIHAFLVELQYDEYFPLFIGAGYDLPTIGRMTPEDLTAIGIKKPNHRKRLKAEIAQLNLPDNLPEFIPGSLEEWLQLLRLDEYLPAFLDQGYQTVDDVAQLTWEDLEEFGIVKLGHQKKIMLAIKRIKDLRAGKRISTDSSRIFTTQEVLVHAPLGSPPSPGHSTTTTTVPPHHNYCPQQWEIDQNNYYTIGSQLATPMFCTDIVPIKIRTIRGKSLESLEDPSERTHLTFGVDPSSPSHVQHQQQLQQQSFFYQQPIGWRPRSYDDGDITPTNESCILYEGGGTLPRPRGIIRPRPIAKITAKARDSFPDFEKPQFNPEKYSLDAIIETSSTGEGGQFHPHHHPSLLQYGGGNKKVPPNPPKRQLDGGGPDQQQQITTTVEIHHHHHHHHLQQSAAAPPSTSPLPLPAYPSSDSLSISLDGADEDLPLPPPPPPAPGTPPHCKLISSHSWGAEEQELIKTLALQHRNGSDASFKSSSSTESDSIPFANENAGTIRTRAGGNNNNNRAATAADFSPVNINTGNNNGSSTKSRPGLPLHPSPTTTTSTSAISGRQTSSANVRNSRAEPADVLNDIGNMLANLTDELDAMLEEEKRQQH